MRQSNVSSTPQNQACLLITSRLYDRRGLDCTSPLPLFNSLAHLTHLTATSPKIREILTRDGGLERLVRLLRDFCASPPPAQSPVFFYGLLPPAPFPLSSNPSLGTPPSHDREAAFRFSLAFQCVVNIGVRGSEGIRARVVQAGTLDVVGALLEAWLASRGFPIGPMKRPKRSKEGREVEGATTTREPARIEAPTRDREREQREQRERDRALQRVREQREQSLEQERPREAGTRERTGTITAASRPIPGPSATATVTPQRPPPRPSASSSASTSFSNPRSGTITPSSGANTEAESDADAEMEVDTQPPTDTEDRPNTAQGHGRRIGVVDPEEVQMDIDVLNARMTGVTAAPQPAFQVVPPGQGVFEGPQAVFEQPPAVMFEQQAAVGMFDDADGGFEAGGVGIGAGVFDQPGGRDVLDAVFNQPTITTAGLDQPQPNGPGTTAMDDVMPTPRAAHATLPQAPPNAPAGPAGGPILTNGNAANAPLPLNNLPPDSPSHSNPLRRHSAPLFMDTGPFRQEDVLRSLQLLAYLTKYPHVRQEFYRPRVYVPVPPSDGSSSSNPGLAAFSSQGLSAFANIPARGRTKDMAADDLIMVPALAKPGSIVPPPPPGVMFTTLFSLVERFTFRPSSSSSSAAATAAAGAPNGVGVNVAAVPGHHHHAPIGPPSAYPPGHPHAHPQGQSQGQGHAGGGLPQQPQPTIPPEIQSWAAVIMRNACRKDDSKGGVRQCANMLCGRWESVPREFAKCRRCRKAKYCGKECQSRAWAMGHRYWCSARDGEEHDADGAEGGAGDGHGADGHGGGHGHGHGHGGGSTAERAERRERARQIMAGRHEAAAANAAAAAAAGARGAGLPPRMPPGPGQARPGAPTAPGVAPPTRAPAMRTVTIPAPRMPTSGGAGASTSSRAAGSRAASGSVPRRQSQTDEFPPQPARRSSTASASTLTQDPPTATPSRFNFLNPLFSSTEPSDTTTAGTGPTPPHRRLWYSIVGQPGGTGAQTGPAGTNGPIPSAAGPGGLPPSGSSSTLASSRTRAPGEEAEDRSHLYTYQAMLSAQQREASSSAASSNFPPASNITSLPPPADHQRRPGAPNPWAPPGYVPHPTTGYLPGHSSAGTSMYSAAPGASGAAGFGANAAFTFQPTARPPITDDLSQASSSRQSRAGSSNRLSANFSRGWPSAWEQSADATTATTLASAGDTSGLGISNLHERDHTIRARARMSDPTMSTADLPALVNANMQLSGDVLSTSTFTNSDGDVPMNTSSSSSRPSSSSSASSIHVTSHPSTSNIPISLNHGNSAPLMASSSSTSTITASPPRARRSAARPPWMRDEDEDEVEGMVDHVRGEGFGSRGEFEGTSARLSIESARTVMPPHPRRRATREEMDSIETGGSSSSASVVVSNASMGGGAATIRGWPRAILDEDVEMG